MSIIHIAPDVDDDSLTGGWLDFDPVTNTVVPGSVQYLLDHPAVTGGVPLLRMYDIIGNDEYLLVLVQRTVLGGDFIGKMAGIVVYPNNGSWATYLDDTQVYAAFNAGPGSSGSSGNYDSRMDYWVEGAFLFVKFSFFAYRRVHVFSFPDLVFQYEMAEDVPGPGVFHVNAAGSAALSAAPGVPVASPLDLVTLSDGSVSPIISPPYPVAGLYLELDGTERIVAVRTDGTDSSILVYAAGGTLLSDTNALASVKDAALFKGFVPGALVTLSGDLEYTHYADVVTPGVATTVAAPTGTATALHFSRPDGLLVLASTDGADGFLGGLAIGDSSPSAMVPIPNGYHAQSQSAPFYAKINDRAPGMLFARAAIATPSFWQAFLRSREVL